MLISPKAKRNIIRIIPFGVIWLLNGMVFGLVEYAALGDGKNPSTSIEATFYVMLFGLTAIFFVGLFVGVVEIFLLNRLLAKKSFTKKVIYKALIYSFFMFVITVILFPLAASIELERSYYDKAVWDKLLIFLTSTTHYSTQLQSAFSIIQSIFYFEISENLGHGVMINFLTGKYHKPTVEKRIFMFSDMKSSTTIAEKLGHTKYFELLREYYADLSEAIIEHSGEIYQYVGDEVVVSWKYKVGITNNNCIRCFFEMKEDLKAREKWYIDKFGFAPTFKAGFHLGEVTTGEIGALKKEIVFTGDVLNSTARIQGLCNNLEVDLLISAELKNKLNLETEFEINSLGKNELRGKSENIELFTIIKKSNS